MTSLLTYKPWSAIGIVLPAASLNPVESVHLSHNIAGWGQDSVSGSFSGHCAQAMADAELAISLLLPVIKTGQELMKTPTFYVSQAGKINSLNPPRMYENV